MAPGARKEKAARWLPIALGLAALAGLAGCSGSGGRGMSAHSLLSHVADRIDRDSRFQLALRGSVDDALALWDENLTLLEAKELGLLMPPTHDWAGVRSGYEWSGTGTDGYKLHTADERHPGFGRLGNEPAPLDPMYVATFGPVDTGRRDRRGGFIVPWLLGTGPGIWDSIGGGGGGGGAGGPPHEVGGGDGAAHDDPSAVPTPSAALLAAPLLVALMLRRGGRSARV